MAPPAEEESHDADDVMMAVEKRLWRSMLEQGHSLDEVRSMRRQQRCREKAKMYVTMEKYCDDESRAAEIGVRLALAYRGMDQDYLALEAIRRTWAKVPNDIRVGMVLAKLLYRSGQMEESVEVCRAVTELGRDATDGGGGDGDGQQRQQDLADAWYIMGWGELQKGNHSEAYQLWSRGHATLPHDKRLARQCAKRAVWDGPWTDSEAASVHGLVGAAPEVPVGADAEALAEGFAVAPGVQECSLGLFDAESQRRRLVFRSRQPLLTAAECAAVIEHCEAAARARGGWGTVRHATVKTTDVAVEDIPELRPWLRALLATRLYPLLAACYPRLADGTDLGPRGSRVRVHDAFVVRYDAERDLSLSLPAHSDISALSFTVALNDGDPGGDGSGASFAGGGTWFKALGGRVVDAPAGHAVAFAGPLRHAGHPVRRGTRIILVLFLYVEGFTYGELLKAAGGSVCSRGAAEEPLAHEDPGGFVVYNETRELVEALDQRDNAEDEDEDDDSLF